MDRFVFPRLGMQGKLLSSTGDRETLNFYYPGEPLSLNRGARDIDSIKI